MTLSPSKEQRLSKLMSYILRHNPEQFNLNPTYEGYISLVDLLGAIQEQPRYKQTTLADIQQVVQNCPKQRYEINEDNEIRARYGHSRVQTKLEKAAPPPILIHGTVSGVLQSILSRGISPMGRNNVHLATPETKDFAIQSAKRRANETSTVTLLEIDTQKALQQGVTFYDGGLGTWLSTAIPPDCIRDIYEP